jgi:hypothetical protein
MADNEDKTRTWEEWAERRREKVKAKEQAQREERKAKEQAQRDERKAKEAESRAQRGVKPLKSTLEKRAAREEAKKYDIDTKGMSTREIKEAVSIAKEAEGEMGKFIEKALDNFLTSKKGAEIISNRTPATTSSRVTEDVPKTAAPATPNRNTTRPADKIPDPPAAGVYVLASDGGDLFWAPTSTC